MESSRTTYRAGSVSRFFALIITLSSATRPRTRKTLTKQTHKDSETLDSFKNLLKLLGVLLLHKYIIFSFNAPNRYLLLYPYKFYLFHP